MRYRVRRDFFWKHPLTGAWTRERAGQVLDLPGDIPAPAHCFFLDGPLSGKRTDGDEAKAAKKAAKKSAKGAPDPLS